MNSMDNITKAQELKAFSSGKPLMEPMNMREVSTHKTSSMQQVQQIICRNLKRAKRSL
jgi:hypothetical protein